MNILKPKNLLLVAIAFAPVALLTGCGNDVEEAPTITPAPSNKSVTPRPGNANDHSKGAGISFAPPEPEPPRPKRRDSGAKPVVHGTANPEYG